MSKITKFLIHKYKQETTSMITIPVIKVSVTQQPNSYDCGLYLLEFAELYFQNPSLDQRFLFSPEIIALKRENLKITLLEKISIYKLGMAKK